MNGSRKISTERDAILRALQAPPVRGYFVWDKKNEDERPATDQELDAGIAATRKRGRPAGTSNKEQVAIRFDRDVVAAFRASGSGWQTRMNEALKDWLKSHPQASSSV